MDVLFELMTQPEAVGLSIVILALGFIYNIRKLSQHEKGCATFRKELRDQEAGVRADLAKLIAEVGRDFAVLNGKIERIEAVVSRIERNGHGDG